MQPSEAVESQEQGYGGMPDQDNLFSRMMRLEGKIYFLDVRANKRGKFLKLTEKKANSRQTVILSGHSVGILNSVLESAIQGRFDSEKESDEEGNWITLFTKRLSAQYKTLYFDVMKNKYGRSLNIAEVSQRKGKSAIIISEQGWLQLQRALSEISESFPGFVSASSRGDSKVIKTQKFSLKGKTIFIDYLQNEIGRLAKVSELRRNRRDTLFVPEICFEPMIELFDSLKAEEYNTEIHGMQNAVVDESTGDERKATILMKKELELEPSVEQAKGKKFNFELRENDFGKFLKVTEFKEGFRPISVFLPEEALEGIKTCLTDFLSTPAGEDGDS